MTDFILTTAQMRRADAYTINEKGVTSETLMTRAGVALAREAAKAAGVLGVKNITVVCGTGNNGGDGFVCARVLEKLGFEVELYALPGELSADCAREKNRYKGRYSQDIRGAIVVECIFGTGLTRKVTGDAAAVIYKINASGAFVISADIPSGLNGDNGLIEGAAVRADVTVAVGELKFGCFLNDGLDLCGKVVKADIGIALPEDNYAKTNALGFDGYFPARKRNSHKGSYGTAALVVGSEKYLGAAALAVGAALKSGCGFVKLASDGELKRALAAKFPQVIYESELDLSAESVAFGSGLGCNPSTYEKLRFILENYGGKLVVDADGLNAAAKYGKQIFKSKKCLTVITPHIKEFSRLTGASVEEINGDPVRFARAFADEYGVTVLLKSASSVICGAEGTFLNVRGTTALAKGGSGDMLAGFLCGTLARGLGAYEGAVCAAQTLGLAAEIASKEKTDYCATAADIMKNLHFSVKKFIKST